MSDLEMKLNKTLNSNNTINISKLNGIKQDILRTLEAFENLNLTMQNTIKTSAYESLQPHFVPFDNAFIKLNINEDKDKNIYKNYKEKIIKGKYTNATVAIKIIDEILAAFDKIEKKRQSIYRNMNNRKVGTLSELALNALPKTEEEFKNKLTESFGEDADIDEYMSVYNFEKNKEKLKKEYNPSNSSSGGRKTKAKKRKLKKTKKMVKKEKTKKNY